MALTKKQIDDAVQKAISEKEANIKAQQDALKKLLMSQGFTNFFEGQGYGNPDYEKRLSLMKGVISERRDEDSHPVRSDYERVIGQLNLANEQLQDTKVNFRPRYIEEQSIKLGEEIDQYRRTESAQIDYEKAQNELNKFLNSQEYKQANPSPLSGDLQTRLQELTSKRDNALKNYDVLRDKFIEGNINTKGEEATTSEGKEEAKKSRLKSIIDDINAVDEDYSKTIASLSKSSKYIPIKEFRNQIKTRNELIQRKKNLEREKRDIEKGYFPKEIAEKQKKERETRRQETLRKHQEMLDTVPPGDAKRAFEGKPYWYGGPYGVLQQLEERARSESEAPYVQYEGERVAGTSPLQEVAEEQAYDILQDPRYEELFKKARGNLEYATETPAYQDVQKYMDPYQERVLDTLEKRMNRNLFENILPQIGTDFISRGMANSGVRQSTQQRALRDMQEAYANEAGSLLSQGYRGALGASQADLGRRMAGAQNLQNLKGQELEDVLNNVNILDKLGTREQQAEQSKINAEYQDFLQQQNFKPRQTARYAELVQGLAPSMNTEGYYAAPVQPQVSPYQTYAGIGMQGLGMMNQMQQGRGFSRGGRVGYAAGGMVDNMLPEEQDYNRRLQMAMQMFDKSGTNPFWSYLGRTGAALASSQNPNFTQSLGAASAQGYDAGQQAIAENAQRPMQALQLSKVLADSVRSSEERVYKRSLEKERLDIERMYRKALADKANAIGNPPKKILTQGQKQLLDKRRAETTANAKAALSEQKLLKETEKALETINTHPDIGSFREPGSVMSKLAALDSEKHPILSLAKHAYPTDVQAQMDIVNKNTGLLFQNRLKGISPKGMNMLSEGQILRSLPNYNIREEAQKSNIGTLAREEAEALLKDKFDSNWVAMTGSDEGAQIAFQEFIKDVPLLDEKGQINKQMYGELYNTIPQYVQQLLTPSAESQAMELAALANDPSISLQQIDNVIASK